MDNKTIDRKQYKHVALEKIKKISLFITILMLTTCFLYKVIISNYNISHESFTVHIRVKRS